MSLITLLFAAVAVAAVIVGFLLFDHNRSTRKKRVRIILRADHVLGIGPGDASPTLGNRQLRTDNDPASPEPAAQPDAGEPAERGWDQLRSRDASRRLAEAKEAKSE